MKHYHVLFSAQGRNDFLKLRRSSACIIVGWIAEYLEDCKNPRARGRSLAGGVNRWRYKIGKYRLLAEIEEDSIVILGIMGAGADHKIHLLP